MPVYVSTGKHRRPKVRFPTNNLNFQTSTSSRQVQTNQTISIRNRKQAKGTSAASEARSGPPSRRKMAGAATTTSDHDVEIPRLFTTAPLIQDPIVTETSQLQTDTLESCLPFLKGVEGSQKGPFIKYGVPALQRYQHSEFLRDALEDYPAGFVILDASRPWILLWALSGLRLLGEDVTEYRER